MRNCGPDFGPNRVLSRPHVNRRLRFCISSFRTPFILVETNSQSRSIHVTISIRVTIAARVVTK